MALLRIVFSGGLPQFLDDLADCFHHAQYSTSSHYKINAPSHDAGLRILTMGLCETINALVTDEMTRTDSSMSVVAARMKVAQPTLHRICAGVSRKPTVDTLAKIAAHYGVTVEDLYRPASTLLPSPNSKAGGHHPQSNVEPAPALGASMRVPVVGSAKLRDDGCGAEVEHPEGGNDGFVGFPSPDKDAYALRCLGDSMRPKIKDGDFVIVYPNHVPAPGDEVVVTTMDGCVMVKELAYVRDDVMTLLSVNEAYGKLNIPLKETKQCQYVAAILKRASWLPG